MSRTITLTTPLTRGAHVERAQRILENKGYFVGKIDGIFGEITARACTEAKFKLGYASKNIKPSYDSTLEAFLSGYRKPTLAMRLRTRQRIKKKSLGEQAIAIGKQYVGVKENPPGSNRVMFSEWYGIVGPWCCMFVSYCFVKAGSKAFARGKRWSYCPFLLDDARHQRNNVIIVHEDQVVAGDIVLYSWKQNGVADHVGIILTPPNGGISLIALEGNTSGAGSQSDGGEVMVKQRSTHDVIGYVRAVR